MTSYDFLWQSDVINSLVTVIAILHALSPLQKIVSMYHFSPELFTCPLSLWRNQTMNKNISIECTHVFRLIKQAAQKLNIISAFI